MLYTNELGCKAAERQALARMADEFLGAGRKIHQIDTPQPKPRPARSAWIDSSTKLKRQPPPAPISIPVDEPPETLSAEETRIVAELGRLAAAGYTKVAAAEALGLTEKQVRTRSKRHAIPFNAGKYGTDEELLPRIKALANSGTSQAKAIAELKIGYRRLYRLLKTHNITLRE